VDEFDMNEWYLWPYAEYNGLFNMSADLWLGQQMTVVFDRPVLRFYGWNPYCISLGYHQKTTEINIKECIHHKIDVVRRPTGGRAILHAEELTYSLIYPSNRIKPEDFYRLTHLPFVKVLQNWGIPSEYNPSQTDFTRFYASDNSAVCFATSAKYEVELYKKKLIGSAQRVFEKSILQHGSLLLGNQHHQLVDFLNLDRYKRERLKQHISDHTAYVWQISKKINAKDLAFKVSEKFSDLFGIQFVSFLENFPALDQLFSSLDYSLNICP
jgi:lipoate-protein ligase A